MKKRQAILIKRQTSNFSSKVEHTSDFARAKRIHSSATSSLQRISKRQAELTRQCAATRWGAVNVNSEKPTSRCQLKCEEGDWRHTRDFQFIWWPHIFSQSNFGHMRLRFYVEHVQLSK